MFASTFAVLALAASAIASPLNTTILEQRAPLATVYTKCSKANTVAITFDDGPYVWQSKIVSTLKKYNAKATFFVNGNNYDCIYSSTSVTNLKATYAAGHQIASHTWAHLHLPSQSKSKLTSEFSKVNTALLKILGVKPAFMRPPYGEYNNLVREVAAEQGQGVVIWDFDSGDSTGSSAQTSINKYKSIANKKPSSILTLNHETVKTTVDTVLPQALAALQAKGYKFVTVAECLGKSAYTTKQSPGKKDSTWKC